MVRRLMAILVADAVGFAHHMEHDEEGTLRQMKDLKAAVFDPSFARHNGNVFKITGDGLLTAFDSTVDAVKCAIDIQTDLGGLAEGDPSARPLEFRIGVNADDVIADGNDVFGKRINVAAQLEPLADAGGVCVSGSVYEQVRNKIDTEFDDLGHYRLKNVGGTVHVFRVQFAHTGPALQKAWASVGITDPAD